MYGLAIKKYLLTPRTCVKYCLVIMEHSNRDSTNIQDTSEMLVHETEFPFLVLVQYL